MELVEFLKSAVTTEEGFFCLGFAQIRDTDEGTRKTWKEEFWRWPDDLDKILERIEQVSKDKITNIYFSPHLFKDKTSQTEYVLPTRTIVADLDDANVLTLPFRPNILVQTSEDRHQGYWILDKPISTNEYNELSQKLTYSIPRCDRSGWWIGHKFRVPDTYNYKYSTGPQKIKIVDTTNRRCQVEDFEYLPTPETLYGISPQLIFQHESDIDWAEEALKSDVGPRALLASISHNLPGRVIAQYDVKAKDRSAALWALMLAGFRAGLDKTNVFILAYNSANNKFSDLRYGGVKELAKDVLRAEIATKVKFTDVKSKIKGIRAGRGNEVEKHVYVANLAKEHLEKLGTFHHTTTGGLWYVRDDIGKPIAISMHSQHLTTMLEAIFGINGSEKTANYTYHHLMTHASELYPSSEVATLSYYDTDAQEFFIHTGRKEVLRVTKDNIETVNNGYNGIIFPWSIVSNIISPKYQAIDKDWADELFDGCLNNIIGVKPEHAKAILKIWFLSVLLRDGMVSRPILALIGSPGSGKSTLIRRVYALLYGKERSVNAVTKEDDFDYAVATDPLVVLDNVDSYAKWLPDRLALSAATSEIVKRKLFTDSDIVVLKRQAMLAITAHAPKWGREDVVDRLLLLTFERLPKFISETVIIDNIIRQRNALWGMILKDIQKVFNTPKPNDGWPQFRVEDFASFGYHIATALGVQQDFYDGIESIRRDQKSFILTEDQILVDVIERFIKNRQKQQTKIEQFDPAGRLWLAFVNIADDETYFTKKYGNAVALGKKLWTLHDALKTRFDVQIRYGKGMSREWKFDLLEEEDATKTG